MELHVWCIFSFSSCFKQNIVVIVSRCSRKPACYRNDVAASCFTADCEPSGLALISYLFLKQKRRFSIKLLKICTCCLPHSLTSAVRHLHFSTRFIKHTKQNITQLQPKSPYSHLTTRGCAFTNATWLIYGVCFWTHFRRITADLLFVDLGGHWSNGAAHNCNHKECVIELSLVGLTKYIYF